MIKNFQEFSGIIHEMVQEGMSLSDGYDNSKAKTIVKRLKNYISKNYRMLDSMIGYLSTLDIELDRRKLCDFFEKSMREYLLKKARKYANKNGLLASKDMTRQPKSIVEEEKLEEIKNDLFFLLDDVQKHTEIACERTNLLFENEDLKENFSELEIALLRKNFKSANEQLALFPEMIKESLKRKEYKKRHKAA